MPLKLSMCFSVPGTEYTAPDYQSFAQGIILVFENNVVKSLKEVVILDQSRQQFHLGFFCYYWNQWEFCHLFQYNKDQDLNAHNNF